MTKWINEDGPRGNAPLKPEQLRLVLDQKERHAASTEQGLASIEPLFAPVTPEHNNLEGLALVCWPGGAVRLTQKGVHYYRGACHVLGLCPRDVKTLDQLQAVRRIDAEVMLQRLMDIELTHWEGLSCQ